jgi:hypothetical protein
MPKYIITVSSIGDHDGATPLNLYQQLTDVIDLKRVIAAVNAGDVPKAAPPSPIRKRATRSDKGKSRKVTITENA